MKNIIDKLLVHQSLTQDEAKSVMTKIMTGEYNNAQIAGFLVSLRSKGESSSEIAGFSQAMRERMKVVKLHSSAIDMCGTGGDARGTFNISTSASFVVAGAGVKVAKHGSRSLTSKSGSADVLSALGVDITLNPQSVSECIENVGLGFMFTPSLHPAMKFAEEVRTSIGIRTVFDLLAPLANPAGVKRQVLGVYDGYLTVKLAKVLQKLGSEEALVVHGHDGMDEITTTSSTKVTYLKNGNIESSVFSPADYGFTTVPLSSLKGGTPKRNAEIINTILSGQKGPHRDIVLLNAAAGILVGGLAKSLAEGVEKAIDSVDSGSALNVLKNLISFS